MRIRLAVSDDSYEEVRRILTEKGLEIDDDAEFVLTQQEQYIGHLAVRQPESGERLHIAVEDIVFIESFGHIEATDRNGLTYKEVLYKWYDETECIYMDSPDIFDADGKQLIKNAF